MEGGASSRLRTLLTEFSTNTSAHGPPKILSAKYVITKIIWTTLFLTGIGVFIYFSQQLIRNYLQYDTTTDMKVSTVTCHSVCNAALRLANREAAFSLVNIQFRQLEFPAVTICNLNQFRNDRLPSYLTKLAGDYLEERQEDLLGGEEEWNQYWSQ
ncbi:SCNN1D [Bugula neritina]|uniref:SCNN1D n=1 Tax=Bugula neritina TaxID=10212 RepID=A0A7J7KF41_BUGNE|nr:SCNN1D [Bugula neritina]